MKWKKSSKAKCRGRSKVNPDEASRKREIASSGIVINVKTFKRQEWNILQQLERLLKKALQPSFVCRKKCFDNLMKTQHKIFLIYFIKYLHRHRVSTSQILSKNNKQVQILRRSPQNKPSRRQYSRKYFLKANNGKIEVCQTMFMNTLSLTLGKIRIIVEKESEEQLAESVQMTHEENSPTTKEFLKMQLRQ